MIAPPESGLIADRKAHLQRAVVRILDRGLSVVGTGFLVAPDLVATCAHVVNQALREKGKNLHPAGQEVTITLLSGMSENRVPAVVEGGFFRDEDAEDVAFLRLTSALPGIEPLTLATSEGTEGSDLSGWAFSEGRAGRALDDGNSRRSTPRPQSGETAPAPLDEHLAGVQRGTPLG